MLGSEMQTRRFEMREEYGANRTIAAARGAE
jgi:hypothetical protein